MFPRRSNRNSFFSVISAAILTLGIPLFLIGCASAVPQAPPAKGSLSLSATSFNFSTVVVGKTSSTQTLSVTNSGGAPFTLETLTLKSRQFQMTGPSLPRAILAGQSVSYTLSFAPTSSGNETTSLQITTDISTAPVGVPLAGVGEKAFATVEVTPASVNFGGLKLKTSGTKTITLKNTGDINITVSGITVAGAGFGYSDLSPGLSLAPNQTATFRVWFKPTTAGSASGSVTILSSNIASPEDIPVSGEGLGSSSPPPPPPPPVEHAVSLSWQPSTSNVTGYRVYRSTNPGASFLPLTPSINALSYTDSTVANGTTYYYVVTAIDADGTESPFSAEVVAVIPAS